MTSLATRRWAAAAMAALAILAIWITSVTAPRRLSRASAGDRPAAVLSVDEPQPLSVDAWTERFQARMAAGQWNELVEDLEAIRQRDPDLYRRYRLGYLHGRAAIAAGTSDRARSLMAPFMAPGDPLRDLALFHAAQAARAQGRHDEAARLREALVFDHPEGAWRERAIADHAEWLTAQGDPERLFAFALRLGASVEAPVRRDLESRVVAALAARGDASALERGLAFLKATSGDDAAERVAIALDRPEWHDRMGAEDWMLVGENLRAARHFDRALALLSRALPVLPARRDELLFAIGRAYFADEKFAEAERVYEQGAQSGLDGETRASFLYQASRCAQLVGDDARAEIRLAQAVAEGGETARASAALTQRIRIRGRQRRFAEALADARTVQKKFANSHAVVEATLALAVSLIGAGRNEPAVRELEGIKPRLLEKKDVPEVQYWRARAVEARDPRLALRIYLRVLRADTPTHFACFARDRLAREPLATRVRAAIKDLETDAERYAAAGETDKLRAARTDAALLALPEEEAAVLEHLRAVYGQRPDYQAVMELPPPAFPRFPIFSAEGDEPGRFELLLAAGLFDDAADLILKRYPLHPLASSTARAEALRRAGAARASIYAAEVGQEDVPDDYVPPLLPRHVRELLYPRYFHDRIVAESKKHGADPRLVLSIMREESRFNPRAKSPAAARGLLQFIITTARQVGQAVGLVEIAPEDLYQPEVIIQLGARYIADLLARFEGNPYRAAAAYNAGPEQAALWARMAPSSGDDFYLTAINFDETKNYVRKVMNSYERYGEIYEDHPPAGGIRAVP